MASPPPFNKRRALQQFMQRNPGPNPSKRGPGAQGSVSPPRKGDPGMSVNKYGETYKVHTSPGAATAAYKNHLAAAARDEARKRQSGGATSVATQEYKNRLAAAARKQTLGGPKKPGLPGKRKFTNNAPFARY